MNNTDKDCRGVKKICAVNFQKIFDAIKTIASNDLPHLSEKIESIKTAQDKMQNLVVKLFAVAVASLLFIVGSIILVLVTGHIKF